MPLRALTRRINTYLYLARVMDYFDPFGEPYDRTTATRFQLISFSSDWRFGTEHSEAMAEHRRHVVAEINTLEARQDELLDELRLL